MSLHCIALHCIKMNKELTEASLSNPKGHVLLLPFPSQGHINPILQFGKRLASTGFKTTLSTTVFLSKSVHIKESKVSLETISDGFDTTGLRGPEGTDFDLWFQEVYLTTFKKVGSHALSDLILKYTHDEHPFTCLVSDSVLPWVLDVGKHMGLITASFFTQSCGVSSIFYHVKEGNLSVPVDQQIVSLPGLPSLAQQDLPSSVVITQQSSLNLLSGQFLNIDKADFVLFNTFYELECEVLNWMEKLWRVRAIGPTAPSMYLDKRVEGDTGNDLNVFKPSGSYYIEWLNTKEPGSVLYISFGSNTILSEEQMQELVWTLKKVSSHFLWVVREKEQIKLPDGFAEEMLVKGLIVAWCSQLEVLAHDAIGCFLTHCGWNSTVEALSLGVPMVAMPNNWDQVTNAKFIADVWETGVRVNKDKQGLVKSEELETHIRAVMEGEMGKAIKINATRWRNLAKEAVDVGGSSDVNIEEFAASIKFIG